MKKVLTILALLITVSGVAGAVSNEFVCKDLIYKEGKGGYLKESSMYKVESDSRLKSFFSSNEINGIIIESYCSTDWSEKVNEVSLIEIFTADKNKLQAKLEAHKDLETERTETVLNQY